MREKQRIRNSAWAGEQIAVEGAQIYIERHGSGDPLICLHNFSANSRFRFERLLPILSEKFTCYLMDLRGHGRSTHELEEWSHEQVARDIIQVARSLELQHCRFLAASSGAMAMLRVGQYAPELVTAMVLDSGTYRVPVEARRYYKHPDSLSPKLKQYYAEANEVYGPEYGPKLAQIFYDFRLEACDINQQIEDLSKIMAPTLFIAGDRDLFFPVDIPVAMQQAVPNSELCVFPDTGHIVMEFFPEHVARLTLDFFTRVQSRSDH